MATAALELLLTLKDEASAALGGITGSLDGLGKATLAVAGGGLVALGAGFVTAVNAAGEFEAGMNNFASVAGSSLAAAGFSLDNVKAKALELGAVTQFSAGQAQDAMINLAKGGVPVADIMGQATDATLALAAAGSLELGPAADIVSKQLGVWGETGVTAAQVADQLAQAANASTVDVGELAMGLSNVAGTAKTAGVDFGDLTQTMALIAPGFSSAADAGTSLKTMIAGFQPTTGPARAAFEQLGLTSFNTQKAMEALRAEGIEPAGTDFQTLAHQLAQLGGSLGMTGQKQLEFIDSFKTSVFYDQAGAFVGMEQAAILLQDAVGGLSEADKVMALQTMFGSDAIRAAAAVANAGGPGFTAMGDAMLAAGSAADQSAIKQQGFAFALDSMKGTIETLQIVIGSALLPVLTAMIGSMTESLNGVLTFAQGILSANDPLAALVAAINTVVPGFSMFVSWLQQAATAAQPLIDMLGANLMPILGAVATVIGGAMLVALGGIVAGFLAAAAPIAALVAGLALLYAAFSSNFMGIQTIVTTALGAVIAIVSAVGAQIASVWQQHGATIMAAAQAVWGALLGVVSAAVQGVLAVVSAVGGQIVAFWQANGASIMATVQTTWAQLGTIISGAIQIAIAIITALAGVVTTVFGGIASFIQANTGSIQAVLTGAWQVIQGVVTAAMGVISGVITAVLGAINGDWGKVWSGLGTIVSSAVQGIGTVLAGLGNIVRGALGLLGGIITSVGGALLDAAVSVGKNIIDGIMKGLSGAASRLSSALKDMATGALNAAKSALGISSPSKVFAKEVGVQIPAGISAGVSAGMPKLEKNLINGIAGLSEAAAKALDAGSKAISAAASYSGPSGSGITGFLTAFADLAIHFNDAALSLGGRILGTATRFADTIGKVAGGIGPAIESLTKLADFVAPSQAAIDAFGVGMSAVLVMLNNVGMSFEDQAWKAAVIFAEAAGKIIGMVGGAVDSLTKLAGFSGVSEKAIGAFGTAFNRVIGVIGWIAQQFLASSIAAAAVFAEGAGKITAMIGPAVDSFTKLAGFAGVSTVAIGAFATVFKRVIEIFGWIAQQFLAKSIAAAAVFAEGAGTMLDMIGSTVDTFTKLAAFSGVPMRAIGQFSTALRATVEQLIIIGRTFTAEAIAAAGVFGDGAGKAVAFIGGAVDSFTKLAEFVAPSMSAIGSFGLALSAALRMLTQVMRAFTVEAIAAAGVFGTEAGKAVGFIGNAVGSFLKLTEFVAPSMGAIGSFGLALSATLRMLIQTMQAFAAEAIAAAGAFGDGAGKAVAFIGNAVGGLIKLGEFTGIGQKAIDAFGLGLHATLVALVAMTRTFAAEAIAAAAVFGEGVGKAIGFIGNAVESFTKLADVEQIPVAAIEVFAANIVIVIGRIVQLAGVVSAASVAQAAAFAANVAAVVKSVQDALSTFATLGDAKVGSDVLKQFMAAAQSLVAQMQAYLPPSANTIGQNTMIGMMNGIVAQRSNLVATMVNTVMAAVMAARAALGIASPSKVFEQIGQMTGAGMAGGMGAMQPAVAGAGAGLGMAAVGGASGGIRSGGGGTGSTISITIAAGAVVNQASTPVDEAKLAARLAEHVDRKLAEKGRGRR